MKTTENTAFWWFFALQHLFKYQEQCRILTRQKISHMLMERIVFALTYGESCI